MFPTVISWYIAGVYLALSFCVGLGWTAGCILMARLLSRI